MHKPKLFERLLGRYICAAILGTRNSPTFFLQNRHFGVPEEKTHPYGDNMGLFSGNLATTYLGGWGNQKETYLFLLFVGWLVGWLVGLFVYLFICLLVGWLFLFVCLWGGGAGACIKEKHTQMFWMHLGFGTWVFGQGSKFLSTFVISPPLEVGLTLSAGERPLSGDHHRH